MFYDWFSRENIDYEYQITKKITELDIRVPEVGDIVLVEDRYGIVFEKIEGQTMLKQMQQQPFKLGNYSKQLAELQIALHQQPAASLPSLHQRLKQRIAGVNQLSQQQKESILQLLARLPEGDRVCHGDFHPDNVLITEDQPVIIDWIDASCGNPAADLARSSLLLSVGTPDAGFFSRLLINFFRSRLHRIYKSHYLSKSRATNNDLDLWMIPIAAARLAENVPGEQEKVLKILTRHMELLDIG